MNTLTKWNPFKRSEELWPHSGRQDPFREMEEMVRTMQQMLGESPFAARGGESMTLAEWSPSVDIAESDKEFLIKAELPEVNKQDIKVNIENGTLCISGERKAEKEEKGTKYHRVERSFGRFERTFTLPEQADREKITSEFKDGILTVHLPKTPQAKPQVHQIEVQ